MRFHHPIGDYVPGLQYELSQRLADQNPGMVCDITEEMVRRLDMCEPRGQKQLLGLLIPWIQGLNRNLHDPDYHPNLEQILAVLHSPPHPTCVLGFILIAGGGRCMGGGHRICC
jgi:hypothetical protein